MNLKKARRALRAVAKRQGLSEREVVAAIEPAIAQAYRQGDGKILAQWEKIPCAGDMPTAYELVAYLSERVNQAEAGEQLYF